MREGGENTRTEGGKGKDLSGKKNGLQWEGGDPLGVKKEEHLKGQHKRVPGERGVEPGQDKALHEESWAQPRLQNNGEMKGQGGGMATSKPYTEKTKSVARLGRDGVFEKRNSYLS